MGVEHAADENRTGGALNTGSANKKRAAEGMPEGADQPSPAQKQKQAVGGH